MSSPAIVTRESSQPLSDKIVDSDAFERHLPSSTATEGLSIDDEVDEADDDGSVFSIQTSSSTSSFHRAHSRPANHRFVHNRRYQSYREDKWLLPDDEQEQDRMQIIDTMLSLLLNGELHLSPLTQPRRILDVGTGTGVWASDMAYKFPNARIVGTDLSPIQVATPDNCTFEIEDADEDWLFPPNYFSMVHTRNLLGGIADWQRFFEQSYRTLHADGWVELHEIPYLIYSDNPATPPDLPFMRAMAQYCRASPGVCGEELYGFKDLMTTAGFVDVSETRYRIPISEWPADVTERELGRYNMLNFLEGIEGYALAVCGAGDSGSEPPSEAVQKMKKLVEKDIKNKKARLYVNFVVLRGRKPSVAR